ncbi:MAG: hypothetical protein H7289_00555, partial [Mucilaginibacter sp.]|nr:hypothetical protein [Mucilaginibacter sp.]
MTNNLPLLNNNKSISNTIFNFLCALLIVSVFFTNLIHVRQMGTKLQLTEVIFLLLNPFIPYKKLIGYNLKHNRNFIIIVLVYLAFDLLSSVLSRDNSAILESAGRFYLLILFTILSYHFSTYNKALFLERVTKLMLFCSVIIILFATYGYTEAFTKGGSRFINTAHDYPYFGTMYRLIGPTIYPTMLISCLSVIILLLIGARPYTPLKK